MVTFEEDNLIEDDDSNKAGRAVEVENDDGEGVVEKLDREVDVNTSGLVGDSSSA